MSNEPLYQTIFDAIDNDLKSGLIKPGEKVPSVKELRDRFNVSHITVMRAYKELSAAGMILSRGPKGYFAAAHGDTTPVLRKIGLLTRPLMLMRPGDNYTNRILTGIHQRAFANRYTLVAPPAALMVAEPPITRGDLQQIVDAALELQHEVDGILLDERIPDLMLKKVLDQFEKPLVVVNRSTTLPIGAVHPPNADGMRSILDFAARNGYTHWVFCAMSLLTNNELERKRTFDDFIEAHKFEHDVIDGCAVHAHEVIENAVGELLREHTAHKVLFVAPSDHVGRVIADILVKNNIQFGRRAGVISFEDLEMASAHHPYLTTLSYAPEDLGGAAVDLLCKRIAQHLPSHKPLNQTIPFNIKLGETL